MPTIENALTSLKAEFKTYTGADDEHVQLVVETVCDYFRIEPTRVPGLVGAIAGRLMVPAAALMWLYWTALLACASDAGGELLFGVGGRVAAARGLTPEYASFIRDRTPPAKRPTERTH